MQSLHARAKHLLLQRMNFSNLEHAITHTHCRVEYTDISFSSKNIKCKGFILNLQHTVPVYHHAKLFCLFRNDYMYCLPFDYLAYTGTIDSNHLKREINVTQTLKDFKEHSKFLIFTQNKRMQSD